MKEDLPTSVPNVQKSPDLARGTKILSFGKPSPSAPNPNGPLFQVLTPRPDNSEAATEVYDKQIIPLLNDFDQRNSAAVDRAIRTLHDRMTLHRAGVKPFAADVTGWGTRAGVIGRYASDFWQKYWNKKQGIDTVHDYIAQKFQADVLSEQKLNDDLSEVLLQFNKDMATNRSILYAEVSLPLAKLRYAKPIQG